MKINKILSIIITIILAMSMSVCYAAESVPKADASASKIAKYVKNNDISSVSIEKLIAWYSTTDEASDYTTVQKIEKALKNKSASNVKNYLKGKSDSELMKVPTSVLGILENIVGEANDVESASRLTGIKNEKTAEAVSDPTLNPDKYKPGSAESSKLQGKVGPILGAIRNVGVVVAVLILMVIGLKYMLGSVEEKANYKQTLFPYLIGAIVLLMGSIIPELIYNTMK